MSGDGSIHFPGDGPLRSTAATRAAIGFPSEPAWCEAAAIFELERLLILGHSVVERWETDYMRELARIACSRRGRVLEVGFGMGIAAEFIQEHDTGRP